MNNHFARFKYFKTEHGFEPKNILDIGALDGRWSLAMKQLFPNANFTLIEANADAEEMLKQTGFEYYISALSYDARQNVPYYKLPGMAGNGLYKENTHLKPTRIRINTKTLDQMFSEDRKFDLIKLDVQGSEMDILSAGKRVMSHASMIVSECQIVEYNKGTPYLLDMMKFFDENNFNLLDIVDLLYGKNPVLMQVDALFRNREKFPFDPPKDGWM
jgi:FkbM family methyltransferase